MWDPHVPGPTRQRLNVTENVTGECHRISVPRTRGQPSVSGGPDNQNWCAYVPVRLEGW